MQMNAIIVLPRDPFNQQDNSFPKLTDVLENINNISTTYGTIYLPKFSCESRFPDIISDLNNLGISSLFGECSRDDNVESPTEGGNGVEQIVHVVHVAVSEAGTENLSPLSVNFSGENPTRNKFSESSSFTGGGDSTQQTDVQFRFKCDKPFQFNVCDGSGMRLLMGVVKNPIINSSVVQYPTGVPSRMMPCEARRGGMSSDKKRFKMNYENGHDRLSSPGGSVRDCVANSNRSWDSVVMTQQPPMSLAHEVAQLKDRNSAPEHSSRTSLAVRNFIERSQGEGMLMMINSENNGSIGGPSMHEAIVDNSSTTFPGYIWQPQQSVVDFAGEINTENAVEESRLVGHYRYPQQLTSSAAEHIDADELQHDNNKQF